MTHSAPRTSLATACRAARYNRLMPGTCAGRRRTGATSDPRRRMILGRVNLAAHRCCTAAHHRSPQVLDLTCVLDPTGLTSHANVVFPTVTALMMTAQPPSVFGLSSAASRAGSPADVELRPWDAVPAEMTTGATSKSHPFPPPPPPLPVPPSNTQPTPP